jgi:TRAP transporter TAXI family solute receptor
VRISNVSHSEMVSYLRDRRIDAWGLLGGLPNPAASEQAASARIRLLDVGKEMVESGFLRDNPFFVETRIPAGTYRGVDYDVTTFAQNGILLAHANVPDDLVYDLTKILWSDACVEYLGNNHRALRAMRGDPLVGLAIPLHPGAARFWRERGLDTSKVPTPEQMPGR